MWYIECGGKYNINNQSVFGRKIFIDPSDIEEVTKKRFNNIDAYSTNFLYNCEDQNDSDMIGPLYLDLDGDIHDEASYALVKQDALAAISYLKSHLKVPKEFIRIYFSGSKGFHIVVPYVVFGIQPCRDLNDKYKTVALEINKHTINKTVDTRIYDKKRLMRLPHSINGKTGLYKVPLSEEMLRASTYSSIVLYAHVDRKLEVIDAKLNESSRLAFNELVKPKKKQRPKNTTSFINPNYEIPLCIKYIYANGSPQGNRNNTLIVLASSILQKGMELEECIDTLNEWNECKNDPPLPTAEVEATIRSAYRNLVDGRRYGCTSIQELGLCVGKQCKLYRQ